MSRVIHYREAEGVYGYEEGDLLISDTDCTSRVVRTGAGLQLEPAIADIPFDEAGDVRSIRYRLAPIDVGFDLRAERVPVAIEREDHVRASYAAADGERRVVSGPLELVVQRLRAAGYIIEVTS